MDRGSGDSWGRRDLIRGLALAGTVGLLGWRPEPAAAEPPPETTRLRLHQMAGICVAPQYVAEGLLLSEGFTDVQYVQATLGTVGGPYELFAAGKLDISMAFIAPFIAQVDAGIPIVLLAGVHVGCFELFGADRVRAIRDLKGKTVSVPEWGAAHQLFVASMAAYVGLDPGRDIRWVTHPAAEATQLLAEGKIDAMVGFPPVPQEMRARRIGHVVVSSAVDRPWSQYFCCLVAANREFVRKHPVATKRAVRAILKASDVCALEPERAARTIVDRGFTPSYDYALQTMKELPYGRWREYEPEDTVRFYALRLHEIGWIKTSPPKIIAQGTDWRFLNELKKELKG
jgi:NitT/TauT family transport system substrate-binding protein